MIRGSWKQAETFSMPYGAVSPFRFWWSSRPNSLRQGREILTLDQEDRYEERRRGYALMRLVRRKRDAV